MRRGDEATKRRGKAPKKRRDEEATNGRSPHHRLTSSSQHPVRASLPLRLVASSHLRRWLLPLAALLTLAGYFGPWVPHRAAGLVIIGLDLGEYVKFLHPIRSGEISLWREGFYLPLIAVSVALSLHAYRRELAYAWPVKIGLLLVAGVAALNLLPPAWSPPLLLAPEFRLLTAAMLLCLGLAATSPLLALLPAWTSAGIILVLSILAIWLPIQSFLRVLPAIADIYGHSITPGWGLWLMVVGLVGMAGGAMLDLTTKSRASVQERSGD
jgi:hypothetical protein